MRSLTEFTFALIGFEIVRSEEAYGFWLCGLRTWDKWGEGNTRALFKVYYCRGCWSLDLFFFRLIGE